MFGYRTYIEITAPRGVCSKCDGGKKRVTTTQRGSVASVNMVLKFLNYLHIFSLSSQ